MIKQDDGYYTAESYVALRDWEIIGDVPHKPGVRKVYVRNRIGDEMRTVYVRAIDTEAECRKADEFIEDQIMNMKSVVCDRLERCIRATFRRLQHESGMMSRSKLKLIGGISPAIFIDNRNIIDLSGRIENSGIAPPLYLQELDYLLQWYVTVSEDARVSVNNIVCMPTDPLPPSPLPSIH